MVLCLLQVIVKRKKKIQKSYWFHLTPGKSGFFSVYSLLKYVINYRKREKQKQKMFWFYAKTKIFVYSVFDFVFFMTIWRKSNSVNEWTREREREKKKSFFSHANSISAWDLNFFSTFHSFRLLLLRRINDSKTFFLFHSYISSWFFYFVCHFLLYQDIITMMMMMIIWFVSFFLACYHTCIVSFKLTIYSLMSSSFFMNFINKVKTTKINR